MHNDKSKFMTPTRRNFLAGTAAGLAGLPLLMSAGGRAAFAADQSIVFWSQLAGSKKVAGEALEAAFVAAHPEIPLETTLYAEPAQLNEKMLTAINGNTGPDLIVQHWDYNLLYGASDKLANLSKLLPAESLSGLDESLLAYGKINGSQYSMPFYGTSRGLGINRKLISEAGLDPDQGPKDWAELREWSIAATKRMNGGMLQSAGFMLYTGDLQAFELFMLLIQGAGGQLLSDDLKTVTFDGPAGVKALQFINQLINEDKVMDPGFGFGAGGMTNPFNQGRTAMLVAGNYSTNNALKGGIEFDVLPFPKENGGFTSLVDPFCFAIRAGAANEDAAATFIDFSIAMEQQVAFAVASKNVPVLKAAQKDPAVQADPYLSKFVDLVQYAPTSAPATPVFSRMMDVIARNVQEVVFQKMSAEQALKDAAAKVQTMLDQG